MPGIVGLVTGMPRERAEPLLLRMLETMRHESFYVSGTWIDERAGVYVGWVARKGSFADCMPIADEKGDAVLVFSGEEYSGPEIGRLLPERGHAVNGTGLGYLVHLAEESDDFPAMLNGRFHGIAVDRRRGAV